jgi:hypothetical protein
VIPRRTRTEPIAIAYLNCSMDMKVKMEMNIWSHTVICRRGWIRCRSRSQSALSNSQSRNVFVY